MNYKELIFTVLAAEDYQKDLMIGALGEIGFDTFEETDLGFNAYIPSDSFNEALLQATLDDFKDQFSFSYQVNLIPQKNWNAVWESNFEPLVIGKLCYVRATFHEPRPEYPYEIVIDPKMAFGTGHHQTTTLMMEFVLETDLKGKSVLDMGCGTGILAILAVKRGAGPVTAIDYDPVCFDSTIENAQLNQTQAIRAICGSKEAIPQEKFDVIFANINRNILLDQLDRYAEALQDEGVLFMSGFYETPDLEILRTAALRAGLTYRQHRKSGEWVAAEFGR